MIRRIAQAFTVAAALAFPALPASAQAEQGPGPELVDRVAAVVGDSVLLVSDVLAEVERLRQITQEATGEMAGELRVGILSTISPYLLPLVIGFLTISVSLTIVGLSTCVLLPVMIRPGT